MIETSGFARATQEVVRCLAGRSADIRFRERIDRRRSKRIGRLLPGVGRLDRQAVAVAERERMEQGEHLFPLLLETGEIVPERLAQIGRDRIAPARRGRINRVAPGERSCDQLRDEEDALCFVGNGRRNCASRDRRVPSSEGEARSDVLLDSCFIGVFLAVEVDPVPCVGVGVPMHRQRTHGDTCTGVDEVSNEVHERTRL